MRRYLAMLIAALALLAAPRVRAEDTLTLKIAGVVPASHWLDVQGMEWMAAQITEKTGGRVKFEYFPAGQLGKLDDLFNLGRNGVVDIAELSTAYVTDKLPLSGVVEAPGLFDTSCEGTAAFSKLVRPDGLIGKLEYAPQRVRVLFSNAFPPYKVFTTERPVTSLADFKGLKLRTSGAGSEMIANAVGAVSVRMTSADLFQSLSRHTLDGVFFALLSARPYDVQTLTKNVTMGASFGSAGIVWIINDRKWNALPEDVRALLQDYGMQAERRVCAYVDANEAAEAEALARGGMNVIRLSPQARTGILAALEPVAQGWAKLQDGNGKQGSTVLAAMRAALAGK